MPSERQVKEATDHYRLSIIFGFVCLIVGGLLIWKTGKGELGILIFGGLVLLATGFNLRSVKHRWLKEDSELAQKIKNKKK